MPLTLTRSALVAPSAGELADMQGAYAAQQCVLLRRFLEPELFSWLNRRLAAAARWEQIVHDALDPPAIELMLRDDVAVGLIAALTHAPGLFRIVRAITACDPIGSFRFRFYRMDAKAGHTDTWHSDVDGNRLVTLSVNLGAEPFEGGALQIRERETQRIVHQVRNTGPGDAILFRIDPALEHYVDEVRGAVSKYALAGWFQRTPVVTLGRLVRS